MTNEEQSYCKFFIFIFSGYVRDSDITLVHRNKEEVRSEG